MSLDQQTLSQLLTTLKRFVEEKLIPIEAQISQDDAIPEHIIQEMRSLGLFGLSIPEAYGGMGLTMEEECLCMLELCRASPAFRSVVGTNIGIGSQGIVMAGSQEQKEHWLAPIASGEIIASFALTEPEAGSDPSALRTTAQEQGDCYVLNGTKRYITNADRAGLFVVMARTGAMEEGNRGISAFLVPASTEGITVGPSEKKMGQQGTHVCDVILENVSIPKGNMLGKPGEGFKMAMKVLTRGRLHVSAVCVAVAERLIKEMTTYAKERKQFGKAIGEHQLVGAMLADSRTEAYAARCMVLETARKKDQKNNVRVEASCCKLFCSEMVGRVADKAVQVYGGAGYIADYGIERFYRDVRLFRLYEGTSQIQQIMIARAMMKA